VPKIVVKNTFYRLLFRQFFPLGIAMLPRCNLSASFCFFRLFLPYPDLLSKYRSSRREKPPNLNYYRYRIYRPSDYKQKNIKMVRIRSGIQFFWWGIL